MAFYVEPRNTGDQQICTAIEAKNWKAALKLVETKKKKKTDAHLAVLEFYISCHHPSALQRSQALVSLRDAASSGDGNGASTSATLSLYDEGIKALGVNRSGPEVHNVCKIRADAVKANRKDEDLAIDCFRACVQHKAYELGVQIATSLQVNFKQERKYQFWIILCRWLYSIPHDVVKSSGTTMNDIQPMRVMHGNLARAMLNKIADQTQISNDKSSTSAGIQTPQELLLFQTIVGSADKKKLIHEKLRPDSHAAKGGWVFWRHHIEMLREQKEYVTLFTVCHKLLTEAIPQPGETVAIAAQGADWLVWKNLIWSAAENESVENDSEAASLIQYYLSNSKQVDKTYRRNAWLAAVEYSVEGIHARRSKLPSTDITVIGRETIKIPQVTSRVLALATYFFRHIGAPSVFADLRAYVLRLKEVEQAQFLTICSQFPSFAEASDCTSVILVIDDAAPLDEHTSTGVLSSVDRIAASLTSQKFSYLLQGDLASSTSQSSLLPLALKNLRMYNDIIIADELAGNTIAKSLLATDMHPADDFLMLAVSCLLQTSMQRQQGSPISTILDASLLSQAAAILEFGLTRSKANAQFNLLLVRIYITLGAGALAIRAYQRLNLKRIQHDTLGYVLYDRISSLHPARVLEQLPGFVDGQEDVVPAKDLARIQKLYKDFEEQATRNVWLSIQHGSYDAAIQILLAGEKIKRSCNNGILVVEQRRMTRLENLGTTNSDHGLHKLRDINIFEDNSDYKTFPNFGAPGIDNTLESLSRNGPAPSNERIQSFLTVEHVWETITSQESTTPADIATKFENLRLFKFPSLENGSRKTVTDEEHLFLGITRQLLIQLHRSFCIKDAAEQPSSLDEYLEMVISILNELKARVEDENYIPAFEESLHPLYTFHELSHLIAHTAKLLTASCCPTSKNNKEFAQKLLNTAKSLNGIIRTTAMTIKTSVDRSGTIDRILEAIRAEHVHASKVRNGEKVEADDMDEIGQYISDMCDRKESFLENLAGELAIAWRDSVQGFSLFRAISISI